MLQGLETFQVDELYLNMVEDNLVSRVGITNGLIVDYDLAEPRSLTPKNCIRSLSTMLNIPIILSVEKSYGMPVEIAPVPFSMSNGSNIRDVVIKSRNIHRSAPTHHPLCYRQATPQDLYGLGLTYNVLTSKIGVTPHTFGKRDVDMSMDMKYVNDAPQQHAMSDTFAYEHAVDFCAALVDPRMYFGTGGKFSYYAIPAILGFGSLEIACQLTRKFIELHGTQPLPTSLAGMGHIYQKVTGKHTTSTSPIQFLGCRVLFDILTTPLDNLDVSIKGATTKLARDAEITRQCLHKIVNTWLGRIYGASWISDEYDPALFNQPEHEEEGA